MSIEVALNNICLKPCSRWAHTEYSLNYHENYLARKTGLSRTAPELWKPIHEAGKKVLFCSDGNFTEFAADVAQAGADGFIFDYLLPRLEK